MEELMTTLSNKHCRGQHKVAEEAISDKKKLEKRSGERNVDSSAGFRYSWRKIDAAAQGRAGDKQNFIFRVSYDLSTLLKCKLCELKVIPLCRWQITQQHTTHSRSKLHSLALFCCYLRR